MPFSKRNKKITRHRRIRAKIRGTSERPRLSVFRSSKHIWAQLIDDNRSLTLVMAGDLEIDKKTKAKKKELAEKVGEIVAQKALNQKINSAVFDRGGYKYHGLVKMVAEGARKAGLKL